ncbi:MAG: hypothetical protein H6672_00795 [Anaerolineaceae bacterium]|nr:hypothetical protein [Anaerolineaceae bacterium]
MLKKILLLVALCLIGLPAAAQDAAPDYAIRNIRSRFLDNNTQIAIEFEVWNIGGAATVPATARLLVVGTGQEIAIDTVRPLQAQEIVTVSLPFQTALFESGSVQSFRATVGIDEVEPADSRTITSNTAQISLTIPEITGAAAIPVEPTPAASADPLTDILRSVGLEVDLTDPLQVVFLVGFGGALLLLLLIVLVILRLVFQRSPDFGAWQPPYSTALPLDPNSTAGRQQGWQQTAQNSSLPPSCAEGVFTVRKVLLGVDGGGFDGWRVAAVRLMHYDRYGRVNRDQALAAKGVVKRLNGVLRRRNKLTAEQAEKRLRPVARDLVKRFQKNLRERTAMLPIALDVRLKGKRGDVRIVFELYHCQYSEWHKVDQWEPEITVLSKALYETYTYAIYGQRPQETNKEFRRRLQSDLTYTLLEMLLPQGVPVSSDTAEIARPAAVKE